MAMKWNISLQLGKQLDSTNNQQRMKKWTNATGKFKLSKKWEFPNRTESEICPKLGPGVGNCGPSSLGFVRVCWSCLKLGAGKKSGSVALSSQHAVIPDGRVFHPGWKSLLPYVALMVFNGFQEKSKLNQENLEEPS
jgi:hypothetical protein